MIAHSKLSYHVSFKFSRSRPNIKIVQPLRRRVGQPRYNMPACFTFGAIAVGCANISCSKQARRNAPA